MKPLLLAASILAMLLAGCSGGDGYETPDKDAQGRYVIHLTGSNTFEPANAKVPVGATVVWEVDAGSHDVSEAEGAWSSADNRTVDEQGFPTPLGPGEEYERTFNEKATYTIWCHMHHEERMKMALQVG